MSSSSEDNLICCKSISSSESNELKRGRLQFGGGTLGHPWGNAPGAVANRVALEACIQARNEGRDLAREGGDIIRAACKWSPELASACEVWKEIKFEFDTIDKL